MRNITIAILLTISSVSQAEVQNFNDEIRQASITQRMLHRKLLRILQGLEVAIAEDDTAEQQVEKQIPSPDFQIRLVKSTN